MKNFALKYGLKVDDLRPQRVEGQLASILNTIKGKTLNGATYVQFRCHQGSKYFLIAGFDCNISNYSVELLKTET